MSTRSSRTWIIVVSVTVFLALLTVILVLACSKSHAVDRDLDYVINTNLPPLSKFVSKLNTMYVPYDNSQTPLTVPLTWDADEGGYMITIHIAGNWIPLVFDTGSSHISAKGLNCQWRQCNTQGTCTVTSCPTTSSYVPRGPQVSMNNLHSTLLEYGSQKSKVTHHIESFSLLDLRPNCADFVRAGNFKTVQEFLQLLYPTGVNKVDFGPTLLFNIYSIEGSTTSNIFGLAQDNEPNRQSVLDAFFPDDGIHPRVWSIACQPEHGVFALGALRCYGPPQFVPLLVPSGFQKFLTLFYTVKLHRITVITGGTRKSVRAAALPKFVVLDTGTTYTYCNSALVQGLQKAGYVKGQSSVHLALGSAVNNVTLEYAPSQLHNAFLTDLQDLDNMFNGTPVLLLGIEQMFHFYFEYNLTTQMLGICKL